MNRWFESSNSQYWYIYGSNTNRFYRIVESVSGGPTPSSGRLELQVLESGGWYLVELANYSLKDSTSRSNADRSLRKIAEQFNGLSLTE